MFGRRTLAGWTTAFALSLAATGPLHAQFSGPAVTITPDTNQPQKPTTDVSVLMPSPQDTVLHPSDLIVVRIFGTQEYAPPIRIGLDGTVQLPLIGTISVGGLTISRAADLIAQRLTSAGMYVNPQVSVQVTETSTQYATVAGEMHAVVPIPSERHLFDVLAAAGNMPTTASHVITILRPGVAQPIVVDLGTDATKSAAADIQILPGDKILVSRTGVVYVLGAFKTQGAIPLQQNAPLTLMQVTALSGGAGFEGRYKDLRIIRTIGLNRTVVKLDIKKVLNGQAPDPVLQADDIVFLPSDNLKAAIKGGGINTVTALAEVLLIAFAQGTF